MKATTPEEFRQESLDGLSAALNLPWPMSKWVTDENRACLKTWQSMIEGFSPALMAEAFARYQTIQREP